MPADLAEVVAAWADLPDAIKTGIMAMVNARPERPKGGRKR
jgi:hypothetical protein